MKKSRAVLSILLCFVLVGSLCACNVTFVMPAIPVSALNGLTGNTVTGNVNTTTAAPATEIVTNAPNGEASTAAPVSEATTGAPVSDPTQAPDVATTAAPAGAKTPDQMSGAEALAYFNSVLNEVKANKVGFTKSKITEVIELSLSNSAANSVINFVKSVLLSEKPDVTTVAKGEDGSNVMSPSDKNYVSMLDMNDIKSVKVTKSGENYVIFVEVNDVHNPDHSGSFGKIFDFMSVDDLMNDYAPKVGATANKEDVSSDFYDSTAELTVSPDGKIVTYKTYVKGSMVIKNGQIKKVISITTDLNATLASTTEYTNFVY